MGAHSKEFIHLKLLTYKMFEFGGASQSRFEGISHVTTPSTYSSKNFIR
jgi:hypothetical protein